MNELIRPAERRDLPEILGVQKAAFTPIAAMLNKETLPPLMQTLDDIEADFENQLIFKYTLDGCIVGSVRAKLEDSGICRIGKLVVLPEFQGCGIGKALMEYVHELFMDCAAFELFTGKDVAYIFSFYKRLGYVETRSVTADGVTMAFMERKNR